MSARLINLIFFLLLSIPMAWYSFKLLVDGLIVSRTNYEYVLNPALFFGIFFSVGSTRFSDLFNPQLESGTILTFLGVGGIYLVAFYFFRTYRSGWDPILYVKNVTREQFMEVLEEILKERGIEYEREESEIHLPGYNNLTLWSVKHPFNKLLLYCESHDYDSGLETVIDELPDRLRERKDYELSYEGLLSLLFIAGWSVVILGGFISA